MKEMIKDDIIISQEVPSLTLVTFRSKVKYHSAHMKDNGEQDSLIEVLNKDEGIIRLSDILHKFLVKFTPIGLSNMIPSPDQEVNLKKYWGLVAVPNMELDEYAGLLAVTPKYQGMTSVPGEVLFKNLEYKFEQGYVELQPNDHGQRMFYPFEDVNNIGYILEPENALLNLFNNKLIHIENPIKGMINIKTSTFDLKGYKCQFPPKFILELSQKADSIKRQEEKTLAEKLDFLVEQLYLPIQGNEEVASHPLDSYFTPKQMLHTISRNIYELKEQNIQLKNDVHILSDNIRDTLQPISIKTEWLSRFFLKMYPEQAKELWDQMLEGTQPKEYVDEEPNINITIPAEEVNILGTSDYIEI